MRRFLRNACVVVAFCSLCSLVPVVARTIDEGRTGGGAFYRIAVPDAWNGDLVIWNHGFDLSPPRPGPGLGPLADLQLAQGYAVAASSYQQTGWALFKTKNDLQHLYARFVERFGTPRAVWVTGGSLGGAVTAQALEEAAIGNVVAAYTFCGANAGSRLWDGSLDLRLIYDAVCSDVPGAAIPGGAYGLPPGSDLDSTGLALAVNECTGILAPPALRTPEQTERLETILGVANIPENFLLTDMGFATFAMRDLVQDRGKLHGKLGTGNAGVDYGDPWIDGSIERVRPNPGAANRFAMRFTPAGTIGPVKVISTHTSGDGLVVVENLKEYADVVAPERLTTAVVREGVPTHCGFTAAELIAGWETLRMWVAGAPQPSAVVIQGVCRQIEAGGLAAGPCRYDPTYVVPDMDGRIRPR